MLRRVSLANKCLLLFGLAAVLIILAALTVPWLRMSSVVDETEGEVSRQMIRVFEAAQAAGPEAGSRPPPSLSFTGGRVEVIDKADLNEARARAPFVGLAWEAFASGAATGEFSRAQTQGLVREYRMARAIRTPAGELTGLYLLERQSPQAAREVLVNTVYLLSAGSVALGLAVLVFYLITTKLILSPVRALRETVEDVRRGDLSTRSEIKTGDEFEELAETFNAMLGALQNNEEKLRAINSALDNRVIDLQSQNTALNEANRVKGEFLANVSHELRTPLNSILGFADLLLEAAEREAAAGDDSTRLSKRKRYLENINSAGRTLLDLINGLLESAKIEAGKVEITPERVDLREASEALTTLMRPVADKRGVELAAEVAEGVSAIETDRGKLQQILYNLLSNAIKFTGDTAEKLAEERARSAGDPPTATAARPRVVLRVEPLLVRAPGAPEAAEKVRLSVLDTGPGIAPEHQKVIFDKFTQLDRGLTRKHSGTGLGLSICKELTALLQGEIDVQSELGRGSMFSVILPLRLDPSRVAEAKLEAGFRGTLATRGTASPGGAP
jgi:signal transduction histidine kinase